MGIMVIGKPVSVVKQLSKEFGGKWKYHPRSHTWECDDGDRYVRNVATGKDKVVNNE